MDGDYHYLHVYDLPTDADKEHDPVTLRIHFCVLYMKQIILHKPLDNPGGFPLLATGLFYDETV